MNKTETLIEIIRNYSILLYDLSHGHYKIIRKKNKIWTETGQELGENVQTTKVLLLHPTMNTFFHLLNVDDIVRKAF
jgi:hypothetical protein